MRQRIMTAGLVAATVAGSGAAASAQQASPYAPRGAVSQTLGSGFYTWIDGAYQSVNLPSVGNFGYRLVTGGGTVLDNGKHDPRTDGFGIKGAVGYALRDGALPVSFGSNQRIELGGSYVKTDGTSSATSSQELAIHVYNLQGVNPIGTAGCGPGPCATPSTLTSNFRTWDVFLAGKSDLKAGSLTLTPSLMLFAGEGRTRHGLAQQLLYLGAPYPTGVGGGNTYNMNAALDWDDWGAKIGLEAKYDVNAWLSLGLGGTAGWADRSASLSASDSFRFPNDGRIFTSSLTGSANTTAFLGSAEANVVLRPNRNVSIKGFGGLRYDSRVPGISGTEFPPAVFVSGSPARIKFESETSYYAGGGVTVAFGP
jgi:hypothetical protein